MIHKFAMMKRHLILLLCQISLLLNLSAQNNSVLSTGNWYKITTNKNGIYKLDYSDFQTLGVSVSSLQTSAIKLYGNGGGMLPKLNSDFRYTDLTENAIKVYDSNNNGVFENGDYILFYGMSANVWNFNENTNLFEHETHLFADEVSYFLTIDNQSSGKRVIEKNMLQNPTKMITVYNAYSHHELELENLIHSGSKWFGERFSYDSKQSFAFSFPDLIQSNYVDIKVAVVARSFQASSFKIDVNSSFLTNLNVPAVSSAYAQEYAKEVSSINQYLSNSSNLILDIEYESLDNGAEAWLNYIELNARRKLKLNGNYFNFRDAESLGNEIGEYKIENGEGIEVWDVTEPTSARKLATSITANILSFNDSLNILHEYIAFNSMAYLTPVLKGPVFNQNIHNIPNTVEFIIVCHPNFLSAANRLADFHLEKDNIISFVVTPQQIYNEFSSGIQDVSAIRDFVKYQYDKDNSNLKYLLLFGDGSYDPKNRIEDNTNYILTYQSANSTDPTLSYVTDDYFGLLDDNEGLFNNDLVDIGIGRFPVSTLSEANILVDKVVQYYKISSFGNWRNDIAFIADDGDSKDGNTHMWQADSLANIVADNYEEINIQKIYLDNYEQESTPGGPRSEDTQNAINNKVRKGALLVNYTGHGGPLGWTQERILEIDQIQKWDNLDNLPLFMTATCKFSYFDNPEEKSAGEHLLLHPEGGAIALLSTTRLVYSAPNYNLNTKFIQTVFEQQNGEFPTLGDVFKTTKVLSGTSANNRNFTLLGDPALSLAYPKFEVNTTSMNDTLKALGEVIIEGQIEDNGILLSDFNGTIYPTVYDKEIIKTTLGQESCTPMPYRDQNNILYKGGATVKDGKFSFSFIVPKDIAYNYGAGKISYYAVNDNEQYPLDANGTEENFVIGGTADNIIYDYDEAELSLFMNDTLFLNGGITDANPILLAHIFDLSGINTVGNGIGHDITAVLDGNTANPYVLNDFYEAKKDDFTRGIIRFPLYNLAKGEHSITLKVWDVFNNSSESTINFVVTDANDLAIADFITFPNPFSVSTDIYFQHNKANQELDYVLDIYSITGVLVKRIERTSYNSEGYRIGPINWDGKDNYGGKISAGMYIANLVVTTEDGDFLSKSIRIILLPQ
ncbi:MAG: type IX secretion system sortase PorU [Bacteroidota bacterium]|nr:type IX secretion system sortase PorU [Bacteroidota bacterium]